jgi:diguanylate cyclase (GGDEF)-like protein
VELTVWAVDVGTDAVGFYAFVHDISERRAYQDAQQASEVRHRLLADQLAAAQRIAGIGSWEWDITVGRVSWSDELCRILGVDAASFVATPQAYLERVHPEDRGLVESAIAVALETGAAFAFDHRLLRPDGAVGWVQGRGQVEVGAGGVPARMKGTIADITERVALQQELAALALVDDLTGLYNRRGFVTLADHQLKVAARAGRAVPLLFVDMDGMKTINDTYGHPDGDRALVEVATFLRNAVRASDLVARVGGDEFCILMVDDGVEAGEADVEGVAAELRAGPPGGERPYPLPLSVGVARLEPGSGTSIEDLMSQADRAMYDDKSSQRGLPRVLVIEDDAGLRRLAELSLQFSYDVVSAATGRAALAEAAEHVPDLVLLDLNLPDLHGTEVLRRLRAVPGGERVAVIVMTAAAGRSTELESLQEGVDDFVTKPLDIDILEARIRNVLHRSSSRPRRLGR